MPHLISANVSALGCVLDILRALDAPLLTNARFDGWRDERFTEDCTHLRISSSHIRTLTQLELCSTVMLNPDDDYQWLMSDSAFLGWRCCDWMQLISRTVLCDWVLVGWGL